MASVSTQCVVLVSIHPKFAGAIMTGEKQVEFRKTGFTLAATHVVVYASSPVRQVLGYFCVSGIDHGTPQELWSRYRARSGIDHADYMAYYSRSRRAIAILIGAVSCLEEPLELNALEYGLSPPQSFSYVSEQTFEAIRNLADVTSKTYFT